MEVTLEALKEVITQSRELPALVVTNEAMRAKNSSELGSSQPEPSSNEFFALIASLISTNAVNSLDYVALMEILAAVIPHTLLQLVRSQFKSLSTNVVKRLRATEDNKIIVCSLKALGQLIVVQETTIWETVYALQSINALLSYLDHSHSKVRKAVTEALHDVLLSHSNKNAKQLRSYVGEFCKEILKACTRSEYKRSLHVLSLLESSCALLIPSDAVQICELSMKLHLCEQSVLSAGAYRMLDSFFQSSVYLLSGEQTCALLKRLQQLPPHTADMEAISFFLTATASALVRLTRLSPDKGLAMLPSVTETLVGGCEADFTQIHCAVGTALKRLISTCITDACIKDAVQARQSESKPSAAGAALVQFISVLESLLQLRHQQTWIYVLDDIRALFSRVGRDASVVLLGSMVLKLSQLYEAIYTNRVQVSTGNQVYLFDALGHILRFVGIAHFLSMIPFTEIRSSTSEAIPLSDSKDWVLNLLQNNIKLMPCRLGDFIDVILPIARKCSGFMLRPDVAEDATNLAVARTRVIQLWALFPGFCYYGPLDVASQLPNLAIILVKALADESFPELCTHIMVGLTHLITSCKNRSRSAQADVDLEAVRNASVTLFGAVLKLVEGLSSTDNRYVGCIQCIEALAAVASPQLVGAVSRRLVELLLASTGSQEDSEDALGWLSILLAVVPYLPDNLVVIIYRTVRPLLSVKEAAQKRAYLVFDALLRHHGDVVQTYESKMQILSLLSEYLLTCSVNARHMRLRCIGTLISTLEDDNDLQNATGSILNELLLCLKDCNKKCRVAAIEVLEMLINRVCQSFMVEQLSAALSSSIVAVRSSAVASLCMLVLSRRNDRDMLRYADNLLPQVLALLNDEASELTKSVLGFIKVCVCVLPMDLLEGIAPELIDASTRCVGPLRDKFLFRVRSILRKLTQRVGEDLLRPHMYDGDVPLLDYILKQDRRAKKKRDGQTRDRVEEILDSDSESDDEDEILAEERPTKRVKAVRAVEDHSRFPSSLDDLLEDSTESFSRRTLPSTTVTMSRKRRSDEDMETDVPADEDVEFKVAVDKQGRVVVERRLVEAVVSEAPVAEVEEGDARQHKPAEVVKTKKRVREPGEEYRSKRAGGDVWKRGQLEPHAYIPLDPRMLSKKNKRAALAQLGSVISNKNGSGKARGDGSTKSHVVVGNRRQRVAARKHSTRKKL